MKTRALLPLAAALLIAGQSAGFAQKTPSAPEPEKSAPLDTGAKPEPTKSGSIGGGASADLAPGAKKAAPAAAAAPGPASKGATTADVAPGATTTRKKGMSHHSKHRHHR